MKRLEAITLLLILVSVCSMIPSSARSGDRIEAERYFIEAQKHLAEGDDRSAENALMAALKEDPGFTSAIWQLSQIYEKRGQLEYARELILRGLKQEPDASWARDRLAQLERLLTRRLLDQAEDLMDAGNYSKAVPKLSQYLMLKPRDPVPLEMLGRCHLALGNLKTAREYLVQAVQRDPSNRDIAALLDEVDRRVARSSVDGLVAAARDILSDYRAEDMEKAKAALEKVLSVDPDNLWATEKLSEIELLAAEEPDPVEESRQQAKEVIEQGIEAVKTIDEPVGVVTSMLRSNVSIVLLAVACVLLALILKKKSTVKTYPLQGSLTLIPLLDIVSLINANLKTGRLLISASRERGEIFFEKGEIVHARFKSHDGKKAFHALMGLKSGKYIFYNHLPNVKHTISEPLSLLLLSMKSNEAPAAPVRQQRPSRKKVGV